MDKDRLMFRFLDFVLIPEASELRQGEDLVEMEPQVFRMLCHLIENRDRVISKDELIETIWDGRIVSDATLNSRVNSLRRAVGDDGKSQSIIRIDSSRLFLHFWHACQTVNAQQVGFKVRSVFAPFDPFNSVFVFWHCLWLIWSSESQQN